MSEAPMPSAPDAGPLEPDPPDPGTLVVTAQFGAETQRRFDAMRQEHFPVGRNRVPAHISLFHTLPVRLLDALTEDARRALPGLTPEARLTGVRFLGRGVAYAVEAPGLSRLRATLAEKTRRAADRAGSPVLPAARHDPEQGRSRRGAETGRSTRGGVRAGASRPRRHRRVVLPRRLLGEGRDGSVARHAGRHLNARLQRHSRFPSRKLPVPCGRTGRGTVPVRSPAQGRG